MDEKKPLTMLRIYEDWTDFYKGDENIARIVRLLREHPGLIDDIWLSTLHTNQSLEDHRECAAGMKKRAAAIRAEGVSVSMQISEFIGHFGGSTFEEGYVGAPEDMMVGSKGETVPGIHCPASPSFMKHVTDAVGIYIEAVRPHVVYIDDDLRFDNHGVILYGCFCKRCLQGFAGFSGRSWTREELDRILNDRSQATEVRQQWTDFAQKRLADAAGVIAGAIHKIDPEVVVGVQNMYNVSLANGKDHALIYQALAEGGGHLARVRIGGGVWNDFNPYELIQKTMLLGGSASEAKRSGFVDQVSSEMEICPGANLSKSPHGVALESAMALAYGCDAVTWQLGILFRSADDSLVWPWFDRLLEWRPYFELLAELRRGCEFSGLAMYSPEDVLKRRTDAEESHIYPQWWYVQPVDELKPLIMAGIPVVWDRELSRSKKVPALITRECVAGLTQAEFDDLLQQGVMLTGDAYHYLQEHDMTGDIGVESILSGAGTAILTDHPFNRGFAGETWAFGDFMFHGFRYELPAESGAEVLLECEVNKERRPVAWKLTTPRGGRIAVFGQSNTFSMHQNPSSLHLLRETLDWLGHEPASVRLESYQRVAVIPFTARDNGKLRGVTLVNCGIEPLNGIALRVRRPESGGFRWQAPGAEAVPISGTPGERADEFVLRVPGLAAWHLGTLFCE